MQTPDPTPTPGKTGLVVVAAGASRSIPIDRKFRFVGFNATNGKIVTEDNGVLFTAKDKALPATLRFYRLQCEAMGCGADHLVALDLLVERVEAYQARIEAHVPDTTREEARRTVDGILPERDRQP